MPASTANVSIVFADGFASVRQSHSTIPIAARILGREVGGDGVERVWLDRLVHAVEDDDQVWDGWTLSGAVSTVLARPGRGGSCGVP